MISNIKTVLYTVTQQGLYYCIVLPIGPDNYNV